MTTIQIILLVVVVLYGVALIGIAIWLAFDKRKAHKKANSTSITLCRKLETIVEMLEVISDPQRNREEAIRETHRLASQVVKKLTNKQEKYLKTKQKKVESADQTLQEVVKLIASKTKEK